MKTWLWAILTITLGAAIGISVAVVQVGLPGETALADTGSSGAAKPRDAGEQTPVAKGEPKIVVEKPTFDFGTMDSMAEKKHDFVIRNDGTAPLEIENKGTSCKCAISDFKTRVVRPGKSTKITLTWTAKEYYGPYEQVATIGTNDPDKPKITLKVKGRVTAQLRASPPNVVFNDISAGHTARRTVRIYAYKTKELEVSNLHVREPSSAEFFKITSRRLTDEELAREQDAKSGFEIDIEVKPGLPLGRFHQTVLASTNLPKVPDVEIPVKGKIGGDITIVGRDWNPDRQSLRLGILPRGEDVERTLLLVVRGRYRRNIDFEVAEVSPAELLSAELGEPMTGGMAVRVPLKIRIVKHDGPANYLGSKERPPGRILLDTNHPQVPQITIPVSFAIEGG